MKTDLGTHALTKAEKMIGQGDEKATLIVDAMAYQIAKEIGAMAAVLEGRVDAIILTGGLAHSARFTGAIKQRVDGFAPVYTYPGENEMEALALGALRVLRGEERAKEYDPAE
jgi:butyrate kinase